MAYTNNAFCWHGVISTDTAAARDFYTQVLPWTAVDAEMGGDTVTMFAAGDVPRLHLGSPQMEGVPSHFSNYLRVADVDALTTEAVEAGGTQIVPPTDIPPGRFSVVTSPSGAAICLFHEADEATAQDAPSAPGGVHWVELHSHDVAADRAWLEAVFGYEVTEMPMPNGPYYLLNDGGGQRGGLMQAMNPQAPSMWLTWIQVPNVDETVATAKGKGGTALTDLMEIEGVGRMGIVQAPDGAVFGVITPPAQA